MRDDFHANVRRALENRAGQRCSNPPCRAATSGPQTGADGAVNVGKAAHITAASPEGPRYDPSLTPEQRRRQSNGIWLCGICADLVDKDLHAHPTERLQEWKRDAEADASARLGRPPARPVRDRFARHERQIKRDLKMRDRMKRDFLRPATYETIREHEARPHKQFRFDRMVIHSVEDRTYPAPDANPPKGRLSGWFRVEPYGFYSGGMRVLLSLERGIFDFAGRWALARHDHEFDPSRFREGMISVCADIPWRNIRHYDLASDNHYRGPHVYCAFADNGTPYERHSYFFNGPTYDAPLDPSRRMERSEWDPLVESARISES